MGIKTIVLLFIGLAILPSISRQKTNVEMSKNNINIRYGEVNTVQGVYAKSMLSQKDEGEHIGHYKIIVNDSLEITLLPPYLKKAKRNKEEVERFEGKHARVTGLISENTYLEEPTINSQPLSVNVPCFITVDSIEFVE